MRIELDRLQELGGRFSHIYQPEELSLEDAEAVLAEPADVRGTIKRSGEAVNLSGEVRAGVEIACGRCLKPVRIPINAEFAERLVPAVSWGAEPQHELTEEDLNLSLFDGEAVDLDELIREEILLAIPGHVLCREDCRGLCPNCGTDRNLSACECESKEVDSRWQKLKDFRI